MKGYIMASQALDCETFTAHNSLTAYSRFMVIIENMHINVSVCTMFPYIYMY